ncbi:MAG TPA: cation:proton antiporter, partial [Armatimonadota bacterium]
MNNELLLLLALAIIISVAKLAGHLSRRYGRQPVVFGELLAGLLLGPTVLNLFAWPFFATGAPWLHETIKTLANIGVLLLMFIAGLETDLSLVRRVGKVALAAAVGGVLLPLVGGALAALAFGLSSIDAIFIGVVLTATSVSISA